MFNLYKRYFFDKILAAIVLTSVFLSFFLEYGVSLTPCKLCLYQRYLWISLLLFCALNILLNKQRGLIFSQKNKQRLSNDLQDLKILKGLKITALLIKQNKCMTNNDKISITNMTNNVRISFTF